MATREQQQDMSNQFEIGDGLSYLNLYTTIHVSCSHADHVKAYGRRLGQG